MRSRDLIDGFDYGEYMQRQMFCFGSSDDPGDSDSTYSGSSIDFDDELDVSGLTGPSTSGPTSGGGGGSDGGITAAQVAAMNAAQKGLGISPYSAPENVGYDPVTGMPRGLETVVAPNGQLVTKNLAGLTEAQRQGLPLSMNIAGMMGSNPYAYEIEPVSQRVIGQIGTPGMGLLGQGISALQDIFMGPPKTFEDLLARGAYTGMNAPDMSGGRDDREEVKPVNPVTGQCDAGYIFDEQLNACRLDTRAGAGAGGGVGSVVPPAPGGYARMGLLDVAPTGLESFAQRYGTGFGTPSDFTAANLAFRQQGATYPDFYKRPPQLSGYTLLS